MSYLLSLRGFGDAMSLPMKEHYVDPVRSFLEFKGIVFERRLSRPFVLSDSVSYYWFVEGLLGSTRPEIELILTR